MEEKLRKVDLTELKQNIAKIREQYGDSLGILDFVPLFVSLTIAEGDYEALREVFSGKMVTGFFAKMRVVQLLIFEGWSVGDEGNLVIPEYCCPQDIQVVKKGDSGCQHTYPNQPTKEEDKCVHFVCTNCGRELCVGIWE